MWAHYTKSHKGICLEFDAQCHPFSEVKKVEYRDTYPALDLSNVGYYPLITKSRCWAYEAEWRLIAEDRAAPISLSPVTIKTDNDFLTIASGVLKSVTIGARADEPTRRRIQDVVKSHGTGVLVRQATVALDSYGLEISPPF